MNRIFSFSLCLAVTALGVWIFFYLPGWVGIVAGGVLLLSALIATVFAIFGRGVKDRASKLWREFFDFLYGL